jgi:hypothetical protein
MHDGGGGFGGGHMGGHVSGGHHGPPAAHHHGSHRSADMSPAVPGYIPGDSRRRREGPAAAAQRFAPGIACLAFVVILAVVLLVS